MSALQVSTGVLALSIYAAVITLALILAVTALVLLVHDGRSIVRKAMSVTGVTPEQVQAAFATDDHRRRTP